MTTVVLRNRRVHQPFNVGHCQTPDAVQPSFQQLASLRWLTDSSVGICMSTLNSVQPLGQVWSTASEEEDQAGDVGDVRPSSSSRRRRRRRRRLHICTTPGYDAMVVSDDTSRPWTDTHVKVILAPQRSPARSSKCQVIDSLLQEASFFPKNLQRKSNSSNQMILCYLKKYQKLVSVASR